MVLFIFVLIIIIITLIRGLFSWTLDRVSKQRSNDSTSISCFCQQLTENQRNGLPHAMKEASDRQ